MNVEEINKKIWSCIMDDWVWMILMKFHKKNKSITYIINCSVMILLNEYRKWNANKKIERFFLSYNKGMDSQDVD